MGRRMDSAIMTTGTGTASMIMTMMVSHPMTPITCIIIMVAVDTITLTTKKITIMKSFQNAATAMVITLNTINAAIITREIPQA